MASPARGAIVLAAYSPDPALFRRQLVSLQHQSVTEWECIVSIDGDPGAIPDLVSEITGHDERFRVIGDGARRGFYGNFEAGLRAVGSSARWIALCDQDDRWDADKLERLLPHLEDVSLVSGQARLVRYPGDEIMGTTQRHDTDAVMTILSNQFTGSLCVFDAELLDSALPMPQVSTRVAAHDHWLAVVAGAHRGTRVVADIVQDYVQHASNVFGDPSRLGGFDLVASVRNVRAMALQYEGSRGVFAILRMTFWAYVGWRQLMVDTLDTRRGADDAARRERDLAFGGVRRWRTVNGLLRRAVADGLVPRRFVWEYRASWLAGSLVRGRRLVRRRIDEA